MEQRRPRGKGEEREGESSRQGKEVNVRGEQKEETPARATQLTGLHLLSQTPRINHPATGSVPNSWALPISGYGAGFLGPLTVLSTCPSVELVNIRGTETSFHALMRPKE